MANALQFCKRCGRLTEHLHIPEGNVYICSVYGCGEEIRTGKKEKNIMAYKKLDERETAELRGNWAALTPEQQTKEAKNSLALKFGVSFATIERKLKGDKPAARKKTRKAGTAKKAAPEKNVSRQKPETLPEVINRLVDERLAHQHEKFTLALAAAFDEAAEVMKQTLTKAIKR